ncbi:MAG: hypothetical protein RSN61_21415 [Chryseobacterium sp.]|uniref:hypothetical protein n=1 Tax=Chryseobacterium sp. TaxID=1871047 RepID=UPI002FC70E4A
MIAITDKQNNVVQEIFEHYRKGNEKNDFEKGCIFIVQNGVDVQGYFMNFFDMYENIEIEKGIEPYKYCYTTEKGFYPNPDWQEPKPYTDEQYDAVVLELVKEGRL